MGTLNQVLPYPRYTTVERDALTGVVLEYKIYNTTTLTYQMWDGVNWIDIYIDIDTTSDYIPKTVYISKWGNDTTGQIENSKLHFATFMGAYNALPNTGDANHSNKWNIIYVNGEDSDTTAKTIFTENDIYLGNDKGITYITLTVPSGVILQCDTDSDKSLFETGTGFTYSLNSLIIYGAGKFYRNGSPTNPSLCHVFDNPAIEYLIVKDANTIRNYGSGFCIKNSNSIIKKLSLLKSDAGSVNYSSISQKYEDIDKIESEGYAFYAYSVEIMNSIVISHTNANFSIVTILKAKDTTFTVDNYYTNAYIRETNDGFIRNCIFENNQDIDSNDCNLFIFGASTNFMEISNSKFYINNPELKNNIRFNYNISIVDGEITNSVFNAGIENLKNSLSAPKIWRRTYKDESHDITIGQDYDLYITPYNDYLWSNPNTVKLTVQPTTTNPEDLIDLFVTAFNDYKTANPESVLKGLTIVKDREILGFQNWYFDIIGDNITYRETVNYGISNGILSPQEFTPFIRQGTIGGLINVIDIDNLNKNILISPNAGKKGIELTHI